MAILADLANYFEKIFSKMLDYFQNFRKLNPLKFPAIQYVTN